MNKTYSRAAESACRKATHGSYRVGCVAFRGGSVIGIGHNGRDKTHTISRSRFRKLHAEEDLIRRVDLRGASVFVTRLNKSGPAMAKPCETCEAALREAGVKRIFYTDRCGNVRRI